MPQLPAQIEDRIRRRERTGRNVRTGLARSIFFQDGTRSIVNPLVRPDTFNWECVYLNETRSARSDVNTAVGDGTITLNNTDSGAAGIFDPLLLTYTDGGQAWDVDKWIDYYLKAGGIYYLILSNTSTALQLEDTPGLTIPDGAYTIVPFKPNQYAGANINPDTGYTKIYRVLRNTETVMSLNMLGSPGADVDGVVTTGDAGAPFTVFRDSAFIGYADDFWNDLEQIGVYFTAGDNQGEVLPVIDFTGSTGEFTVSTGFSNTIDIGDTFRLIWTLKGISVGATWSIISGYIPSVTDFENAAHENIHHRVLRTGVKGDLYDHNFPKPFVGRYAVEIYSEASKAFSMLMTSWGGGTRVDLVNLATGMRTNPYASGARTVDRHPVVVNMNQRTWYRIEIYIYVPELTKGLIRVDGLTQFITSWRDITPGAPTVVSVSGADSSNNDDAGTMEPDTITIAWTNNPTIGVNAVTEIWESATEGGSYSFVAKVGVAITSTSIIRTPGSTKWYKLRHVTASGVLGVYTAARKGRVSNAAVGETTIDLEWVANGGTPIFPNENGWFNDAVLKAKITVTSELTISAIKFMEGFGGNIINLGSSSPATSAAIATQTDNGLAYVMVTFTNGQDTGWVLFNYKYDKTAPPDPVIDSMVNRNYALLVALNSAYAYPSDFLYFQFHWDVSNTAPTSDLNVMGTARDLVIVLPLEGNYVFADIFYFWVRAVDEAGNVGSWVSTSISVDNMELTGTLDLKDLWELSF